MFGSPELSVDIENGVISNIIVKKGAPCGATWEAAQRVIGLSEEEAPIRFGLEVQYFCSADPADWDPIHGKSPVHFAGHIHRAALERGIKISS